MAGIDVGQRPRPPKGGGPASWPRHPHRSRPLLPSGPGGIFNLASRGADGATIDMRSPCDALWNADIVVSMTISGAQF